MKLEIYFFTQVCAYNNLSKWKIGKPLYPAVGYRKKTTHGFSNLESMDPYS